MLLLLLLKQCDFSFLILVTKEIQTSMWNNIPKFQKMISLVQHTLKEQGTLFILSFIIKDKQIDEQTYHISQN